MRDEDECNRSVDHHTVHTLACSLEQAKIADQKCYFEEANAELVDGTTSKVDFGVGDEVRLGTQLDRQAEAVASL